MREEHWRSTLEWSALRFVGTAAFPRLAYRLRWPSRLGPRGLLVYVACNTLALFAIRTWILPALRDAAERHRRAVDDLREQLGREPTEDEVLAHLGDAPPR